MKKSDFVKKVLKKSCCLVNEAQVLHTLEIFEKLGMKKPERDKCFKDGVRKTNEWEPEDNERNN
jgi:hypothetical protein